MAGVRELWMDSRTKSEDFTESRQLRNIRSDKEYGNVAVGRERKGRGGKCGGGREVEDSIAVGNRG